MAYQVVGEVETDGRGRVSLGKIQHRGFRRYRVEENEIGELRLVPLLSVPVRQLPPWTNREEFDASMKLAQEQADTGQVVDADFAQYVD